MTTRSLPHQLLAIVLCSFVAATAVAAEQPVDSPARIPPKVNFAPGPEYADQVRMFQGIPGVERAPNGRLWATWYGGGVTEDRHNYILLTTSADDGHTWSAIKLVIDPDRDGPVRAFDPCLWHDPQGRLWLFWAQRARGSAELMGMNTSDPGSENPTWTEPRWIATGVMMNKPTVLTDGAWLLPLAIWHDNHSSRVVRSTDHGATWAVLGAAGVPKASERNCDEHMIVQRKDGSLWMLVRTMYGIGESTSSDGGKTWTDVTRSSITHPTTRFFIRRLRSGRLLLVKHSPPNKARVRSHLTAYLSDDDGKTFHGGLLLDERLHVSYPDAVESPEGVIYLIYDFARQAEKQIFMAVFTEADVAAGKIVSDQGRLRVVVNQATGKKP